MAYQVPTSWAEVTFAQFLYWQYSSKSLLDTVVHLTGIPRETFLDAEKTLFDRVVGMMTFLQGDKFPEKPTDNFTFVDPATGQGVFYSYDNQLTSITLAHYIDVETRLEEFTEEPHRAFPYVAAILYLPPGEKYDSKTAAQRAEAFHQLPVSICLPVVSFFLSRRQSFERNTKLSQTLQKLRTSIGQSKSNSLSTGAGSAPLSA